MFQIVAQNKALDHVRAMAGGYGHGKIKDGFAHGLRKAIAHVQREHKKGGYFLAGGRGKNPRPPVPGHIVNRSHTLSRSYKTEMNAAQMMAAYGSGVKYAPFLEEGTRPYLIKAKNAKGLNIPGIGWRKFARHPGIEPRKTLERTEQRTREAVDKIIADAAVRALTGGK